MTFLKRNNQQIVKAGPGIRAHLDNIWIDDLDQRTNHFPGCDAEELIFLRRLTYHRSGIDRVPPTGHFANMEDWKLSRFRVVSKMVAERPLHPSLARWNDAFQDELRSRRNHEVEALGSNHRNALTPKEASEGDFVDVLRQGQYGCHHQDRIGADHDRNLQVLSVL